MIPKIIHYTWFSGEPFPKAIADCIASWHRHMPDWQYRLWDAEAIKAIDLPFLHEALAERKWAFAADVVRTWAVYHEGGIYLDTDALVLRPLDPLLSHRAFIGRENSMHIDGPHTDVYLGSHCFGAEAGNAYLKRCLDYYDGRHFVTSPHGDLPPSLRLDMRLLPYIQSELARPYGYNPSVLADGLQQCGTLTVYPSRFFDAVGCCADSYVHHLALGSWRTQPMFKPRYTLRYKIEWRLRQMLERILRRHNYIMVKLR